MQRRKELNEREVILRYNYRLTKLFLFFNRLLFIGKNLNYVEFSVNKCVQYCVGEEFVK